MTGRDRFHGADARLCSIRRELICWVNVREIISEKVLKYRGDNQTPLQPPTARKRFGEMLTEVADDLL